MTNSKRIHPADTSEHAVSGWAGGLRTVWLAGAIGSVLALAALVTSANAQAVTPNTQSAAANLPTISMSRTDLVTTVLTGQPNGGSFDLAMQRLSGETIATIDFAPGVTRITNPNKEILADPPNNDPLGRPVAGGLALVTANYTASAATAALDRVYALTVPTFGLSCYMIALESDYGSAPDHCSGGNPGTIHDPAGLVGTFCKAFLDDIRMQGSGVLNDGRKVQYAPVSKRFMVVSKILTRDGTEVIAGQTVARDPAIIPQKGAHIEINGVGPSLLANDTGGAIVGYRLDLFNGAGVKACRDFENPIAIAACKPAQPNCPERVLP